MRWYDERTAGCEHCHWNAPQWGVMGGCRLRGYRFHRDADPADGPCPDELSGERLASKRLSGTVTEAAPSQMPSLPGYTVITVKATRMGSGGTCTFALSAEYMAGHPETGVPGTQVSVPLADAEFLGHSEGYPFTVLAPRR